jgi:murein DD-endopeptidase MepM/ murein hydrolase activator NlpD
MWIFLEIIIAASLLLVPAVSADQVIPPGNEGPPYFYPDSAKDRLYKLPWKKGKAFSTGDGYGSEPGGSHHPDYSVDFNMPDREPILASRGGRVTTIRNADTICNISTSIGNIVMVSNLDSVRDSTKASGWRYVTVRDSYLHIWHDVPVNLGDFIKQGQVVAYVSCTGQDGGSPHLHFRTFQPLHQGEFADIRPGYYFESIPTPFVEVIQHPNGLAEEGDLLLSQNTLYTEIEAAVKTAQNADGLLEALPNPFNVRTTIKVYLGKTQDLNLNVMNIRGEKVADLAKGVREGGLFHSFNWDAGKLPAGIYFCRLSLKDRIVTQKILLVR